MVPHLMPICSSHKNQRLVIFVQNTKTAKGQRLNLNPLLFLPESPIFNIPTKGSSDWATNSPSVLLLARTPGHLIGCLLILSLAALAREPIPVKKLWSRDRTT